MAKRSSIVLALLARGAQRALPDQRPGDLRHPAGELERGGERRGRVAEPAQVGVAGRRAPGRRSNAERDQRDGERVRDDAVAPVVEALRRRGRSTGAGRCGRGSRAPGLGEPRAPLGTTVDRPPRSDPLPPLASRPRRLQRLLEPRGHRRGAHVGDARGEQLAHVRGELALQLAVAHQRRRQRPTAPRRRRVGRASARRREAAPSRARRRRRAAQHLVGRHAREHLVQPRLERRPRRGRLEPDGPAVGRHAQRGRPRPQVRLLDLAVALQARGGESLVGPCDRGRAPLLRSPHRHSVTHHGREY